MSAEIYEKSVLVPIFGGKDFVPDASQMAKPTGIEQSEEGSLDELRKQIYDNNDGLFLVHAWRVSEESRYMDIDIRLQEHPGGPDPEPVLGTGKIASVTYELGRKFSNAPLTKDNEDENFALEVSAYSPMLCVAEVQFNDNRDPIRLSRYIDFPVPQS